MHAKGSAVNLEEKHEDTAMDEDEDGGVGLLIEHIACQLQWAGTVTQRPRSHSVSLYIAGSTRTL